MKRHPLWSRVILALDAPSLDENLELCKRLRRWIRWVKVGPIAFLGGGPNLVETLHKMGFQVFLDLKFHDIPHTLANAVQMAATLGVEMVNVHALSGPEGLRATVSSLSKAALERMRLIAVTMLTSHSQVPWDPDTPLESMVIRLARWAFESGYHGVVCSPLECALMKQEFGPSFLTVTPGIRLQPTHDDQKRWHTPWDAFRQGADYIVMGRSLEQSSVDELNLINQRFYTLFPPS